MMYMSKKIENIEFFKLHYNDEVLRSMYKYLYTINMDKAELLNYIDFFKKCEKLGFSYFLYYIDSFEDSGELIGFSNFEILELGDSHAIDLTGFDDNHINRYFCKIFREDGYFIVSDNSVRSDTEEEERLMRITNEVLHGKRKPHLFLLD